MQRDIYRCPVTQLFFDPLAIRRTLLMESAFKINEWIEEQKAEDRAVAWAAQERVIAVARKAFGFARVDGNTGDGIPDQLVIDALNAYTEWLEGKGGGGQNRGSLQVAPSSAFPPSSATKSGCASC